MLLATLTLVACTDDEGYNGPVIEPPETSATGAYVINQGNAYGGVAGTIDFLDTHKEFEEGKAEMTTQGLFAATNQQSLGDGPQQGVVYGSKIYMPMYGSNLLWILDKQTLRILGSVKTTEPEGVCASGEFVYVTNNDGYVTRVDTATYTVSGHTKVGPNPVKGAVLDGKLYVTVSDGYNYENNYENGKRVAVVDANTMEKLYDIGVGLNPGNIVADSVSGKLFVVNNGNYADVAPTVDCIDPLTREVKKFADGSLIANNLGKMYVVKSVTDWDSYETKVSASVLSTITGETLINSFFPPLHTPAAPQGINVNPYTGDVYVVSDTSASAYAAPGVLYRYKSDGTFTYNLATGIHPVGVLFF